MGWESIKVPDGTMRLYVSRPEGAGPFPGVIVIQGQKGVDRFIEEVTERLAREGYAAAGPDLYHRDPPDCRDGAQTRRARLRDNLVIQDVNAAADYLARDPKVDAERLAIMGFCMGGRVTLLMSSAGPRFKAGSDFYGGNAFQPWGDGPSPFERAADIHCPLMGHFGLDDENPSPADINKLDAELKRLGKRHEFYSYEKTGHAFMDPHGDKYRAESAATAWKRTLEFFGRELAPSKSRAAS